MGDSLFVMGDVDYTRFITVPNYKVTSSPVTKEYTDINEVTHKEYIGDKISGSFTLKFFDDASYDENYEGKTASENFQDFFNAYNQLRDANGLIEIQVYVNNLNATQTIQAFMDMTPKNTLPYMEGGKEYDGFDVTITSMVILGDEPIFINIVVVGYYNPEDGKFYEYKNGNIYKREIVPELGKFYIDRTTTDIYEWDGSAYTLVIYRPLTEEQIQTLIGLLND